MSVNSQTLHSVLLGDLETCIVVVEYDIHFLRRYLLGRSRLLTILRWNTATTIMGSHRLMALVLMVTLRGRVGRGWWLLLATDKLVKVH